MGWLILILVLIAVALGILGVVIKAVAIIVLTIIFTMIALGAIAYYVVRHQARRFVDDANRGRQLPS